MHAIASRHKQGASDRNRSIAQSRGIYLLPCALHHSKNEGQGPLCPVMAGVELQHARPSTGGLDERARRREHGCKAAHSATVCVSGATAVLTDVHAASPNGQREKQET